MPAEVLDFASVIPVAELKKEYKKRKPSLTRFAKTLEKDITRIRFTDQHKKFQRPYDHQWKPFSYRQFIRNVLDLWEEMTGITLVPRILEVAIDTWDSVKGTALIKNFLPPWFNPASLYHFNKGHKVCGPSPWGGNHEYSSYTRAGRKVPHSYIKEVQRWDRPLYRVEIQFLRTFLREYCRREGITRTSDLLARVSELAASNISFATLDIDKLYRRFPSAGKWKLRRLSTRGQIYTLQLGHGMSRKQIDRFLIPMEEAPMTDYEVSNLY